MIEKRGRNIVKRTHEKVINIFGTKFFLAKKLYSVKLYQTWCSGYHYCTISFN